MVTLAMLAGVTLPSASAQAVDPSFALGFKALADQIPNEAGQPTEKEHYGANGDSLQRTTKGLMVWRKADNWTAFTNGSWTWINGPYGVQRRSNDTRFEWETIPVPSSPTPPPIYVYSPPSDFDVSGKESVIALPDGSHLFRDTVSNVNHYWTAADIQVWITLRDADGRVVLEARATSITSGLGPQQSGTWELAIPTGVSWQTAFGKVFFQWQPPGGQ